MTHDKSSNLSADLVKTRDAVRQDIVKLNSMIGALAKFHGDTPEIDAKALERDVFGVHPWIYIVVAEINQNVIGYAALCPLIRLQVGMRGIDMHHLFVEEEFRGLGVGKALIEASKTKARELECGYMTVGTHPDNSEAQAMYLASGFEARDSSSLRFSVLLA